MTHWLHTMCIARLVREVVQSSHVLMLIRGGMR